MQQTIRFLLKVNMLFVISLETLAGQVMIVKQEGYSFGAKNGDVIRMFNKTNSEFLEIIAYESAGVAVYQMTHDKGRTSTTVVWNGSSYETSHLPSSGVARLMTEGGVYDQMLLTAKAAGVVAKTDVQGGVPLSLIELSGSGNTRKHWFLDGIEVQNAVIDAEGIVTHERRFVKAIYLPAWETKIEIQTPEEIYNILDQTLNEQSEQTR